MDGDEADREEVLNRIAAIQAAAEILHDNDDMPHHERRVFLDAIGRETSRLSRLIQGCVCSIGTATP
ncbi:MAG: hypothetical protein ACM32G_02760 [Betaproteobacteria bacterium]